MTLWCREENSNTFPFDVLNCTKKTDFRARYLQFLFPVLIREGKTEEAISICDRVKLPYEQAFNNYCYSIIPWALIENEELIEQLKNNSGLFQKVDSLKLLVKNHLQQIFTELGNIPNF